MRLYTQLCWSICQSICRSVRLSHFIFLMFLWSFFSLLLPKCSSALKYSPCPPTRDWGSCASGLDINENSLIKTFGTNHNFPTILTLIVPNQVAPVGMAFVNQDHAEMQIHGSRVAMLRGRLGPRCGRCGRIGKGK